jgi:hypothetical protein
MYGFPDKRRSAGYFGFFAFLFLDKQWLNCKNGQSPMFKYVTESGPDSNSSLFLIVMPEFFPVHTE